MKKLFFITLILGLLGAFILRADAKPIELKAVTFVPKFTLTLKVGFLDWMKMVNEAAKGELVIKYVGGPEAVPRKEQPEALRMGAIDLLMTVDSFYAPMLPKANVHLLSKILPMEERKTGFFDYMVELHKKTNIHYVGRSLAKNPFYFGSKKPYNSYKEMKGKTWQASAGFTVLMKKLGAVPLDMAWSEVYSALERGLVEGVVFPAGTMLQHKMYEQFGYFIGPPFLWACNGLTLMNLKSWEKLPKHLKDILSNSQIKMEPLMVKSSIDTLDKQMKTMTDAGVKFVKWPEADTKDFLKIVEQVKWGDVEKKTSASHVSQMKKLLGY